MGYHEDKALLEVGLIKSSYTEESMVYHREVDGLTIAFLNSPNRYYAFVDTNNSVADHFKHVLVDMKTHKAINKRMEQLEREGI